jgi:hypothetical protein
MHRLVYVLCLMVSLPISAHAISNISNASCLSGLTSELVNGVSFACACNSSITAIQNNSNKILNWSEFNIPKNSGAVSGAVISVSDGRNLGLKVDAGDLIKSISDKQVVGGEIVIGSGSGELVTTGNNTYVPSISLSAVPEPSTYLMVLLGLGFITYRRQFKH